MIIGLLFGSFDPIHVGHLYMATAAINNDLVDKVLFIPAKQNPWKTNKSVAFKHRCEMVALAIKDIETFELSKIELQTQSCYTATILELLMEEFPNDELVLILGADTIVDVKNWYLGPWIIDNFRMIAVTREGFKGTYVFSIDKTLDISSTEIRNLSKQNKQLYPLVPKEVEQYINTNNLYK